jgi:hypothetical protein
MRIATLVLLGSLVLGSEALAQSTPVQPHKGLWGGFGLGGGVNLTDTFGEGSLWGFSGYGRIGGTLNQRVLLGAESAGWFGSRGGVDFSRGNLSGVLLFYPSPSGGFFLKGGIGFAYIMTSIYSSTTVGGVYYQNSTSQSKGGFGATAGVGYDLKIGRNIYLVPEVGWYLQAVGSQSSLVFGDTPGTNNIIAFALGLVWH